MVCAAGGKRWRGSGGLSATRSRAARRPCWAGYGTQASTPSGIQGASLHTLHQGDPMPAQGLHPRASGGLCQTHESLSGLHTCWVKEFVNGTLRITHQGRTLGVHAMTLWPVKAAAGKSSRTSLWRIRLRRTKDSMWRAHRLHRTSLCGRKRTCLYWVDIKGQSFLTACRPSATVADECRF